MLSKVLNNPDAPDWYKNSKREAVPDWYSRVKELAGPPAYTPETVNQELESVPPHARKDVAMKLKLPGVGKAPRNSQVVKWSYFNTPIDKSENRRWVGNSRKWGDIDEGSKKEIVNYIVENARAEGLSDDETAYLLALTHVESGFNPDAAAGPSSASGLGQFINRTGAAYGINDQTRWDAEAQVNALIKHFKDNLERAKKRGQSLDWVYAYHHDGPSAKPGGLGYTYAKSRVRPMVDMYKQAVI